MARTLPNSKANPDKDRDEAYNRIVNRGEDLAHQILAGAETQIADQPDERYPNRGKNNSPS